MVLHSYHETSSWVKNIQKGIEDTIDNKFFYINMYIENMDTKRFNSKEYYLQLKQIYKLKYKDIKLDAIISSDNNAFNFLKKYRDELFGDIPVSFCGVNFFKQEDLKGYKNYTGVAENEDFDANIKLIKKLNPNLKKIYITGDYIVSGKLVKNKIRKLIAKNNYNLEFVFSPNKPFKHMLNEISELKENSAVLYGIYFKDSTGTYLTPSYSSTQIIKASKVPVFTMFDIFMKNGVLGGNMISSYYQGKFATQLINKVLQGEDINNLPVVLEGSNKNVFDFRVMTKFNLSKTDIPKDSIILNKDIDLFSKDELNWIVNHQKVTIGGEMDWEPFDFVNKYGDYDGITNDILKLISKKTGLKFDIKTNLTWKQLLQEFKKGNIDILPAIYYTKDREKFGSFTKSYINIQEDLFVLKSSSFHVVNDLKSSTFAGIKGYINIQQFKQKFPNIKIIEVKNIDEAIKLLSEKKVDALIEGKIVLEHILNSKKIINIRNISQSTIDTKALRMLIQKDKKYLFSIIQKSLNSITEQEIVKMKKRWSNHDNLILSKSKKDWIQNHKTLFYSEVDWKPFIQIKNEKIQGAVIELMDEISKLTGIEFKLKKAKDFIDVLSKMSKKEVDFLPLMDASNINSNYIYSKPFFKYPLAIATKNDYGFIDSIESLKDEKIAVHDVSSAIFLLQKKYPKLKYIKVKTPKEGLNLVKKGKVIGYIDLVPLLNEFLSVEYNNLKISGIFKDDFIEFSMQTHKKNKIFIDIVNEALQLIGKNKIDRITQKYNGIQIEQKIDYRLIYEISGVFILFILATLYWVRKLNTAKQEIERTKKEIEEVLKHTTDSINYASLIQGALIPDDKILSKYFDNHFIIWDPKDVVGGDIYLFEQLKRDDEECLFMVIDCTGHGVPGAFVTMLVKAIEQQIIAKINNDKDIEVSPAWILSYFNKSMKRLLKQEDKQSISNAGFDGQIAYYNKTKNIFKSASARNEIFYIENNDLKIIKPSRHSVGYKDSDFDFIFKDTIIEIKNQISIYISSDGFWDQNGGEHGFCYGKKRLKKLLLDNNNKRFDMQKDILKESLIKYQGKEERNDDITFLGISLIPHKENKIIISYEENITTELIDTIMNQIRNEFEAIENVKKQISKISYIAVEQLQNALHYNRINNNVNFEIGYSYVYKKYYISTNNHILQNDIQGITKKLDKIINLDKDELKIYFKELLKKDKDKNKDNNSRGAGVGFVDMARKSSEKIQYEIKRKNDIMVFTILIYI